MVRNTLSLKNPLQKRAGGAAQGVGPEFKLQYCKKKTKQNRSQAIVSLLLIHRIKIAPRIVYD
jgi:hypothetical protein